MEINNYGFVIPTKFLTKELLTQIKKDLIVSPESKFGAQAFQFDVKSFKVYRIENLAVIENLAAIENEIAGVVSSIVIEKKDSKVLILPIYYATCILKLTDFTCNFTKLPEVIKVAKTCNDQWVSSIKLRPGTQEDCLNKCILELNKPFGGGIINLSTGTGKTIVSLQLISVLKQPTLIIVNKLELIEQWKKEIAKFIPGIRIGLIQGANYDIIDKDIVLGMVQSIAIKKTLTVNSFKMFKMCIIDEIHNISSEVFSNIIFKVRPQFLFGLTGTLERKDGLHKLIHWYLGDIIYSNVSSEKKQGTEIQVYRYRGPSSNVVYLRDLKTAAVSTMLSNIALDKPRNKLIISILKELTRDPERQVLLISDRIAQLQYLNASLSNSALYIGKMKTAELEESKKSQILLATYKLASEGFSLAKLNCLVFATPRSSITQAVGRIYRQNHTVKPIIIDIQDDFSIFKSQYYRRRKIYKDAIENCEYKTFNIDGNNNETGSAATPISLKMCSDNTVNESEKEIEFLSDSDSE